MGEQNNPQAVGALKEKRFEMLAEFKSVKQADDGHIYIEGYASTFTEDLEGETVAKDAFNDTMEEYMLNPVVLANHQNSVESVVGKTVDAKVDNTGLWVRVQLSNSQDPFTTMVRDKVKEGLLRAFSIGGLFQYQYPVITKVKLLEISIVAIPANSYALFSMAKAWKGLEIAERKAVSGATDLPLADRNRAWDAAAAVKRVREWAGGDNFDQSKFAKAFFYYDENAPDPDGDGKPDAQSAYKLPFADVINGELKAVPRGIFAVAAALQGARGGVNIPEKDVAGIKKKVEQYYARMRKEFGDDSIVPPWQEKEVGETLDVAGDQPTESGEKRLDEAEPVTSDDPAKEEEPTIDDYYKTLVQIYKERGGF